jgi:homoserine acetyltransferase
MLHHHSGWDRPRQIVQTVRRAAGKFPKYDYADMVDAQYRLLKEGLGVSTCAW